VLSIALHFGPAARAPGANAQSTRMARLVFIEFPYEGGIARRNHNRKSRVPGSRANQFQISVV
jgi:hypothetical protein